MILAEETADSAGDHIGKWWIFIEAHANELGLSGADAKTRSAARQVTSDR